MFFDACGPGLPVRDGCCVRDGPLTWADMVSLQSVGQSLAAPTVDRGCPNMVPLAGLLHPPAPPSLPFSISIYLSLSLSLARALPS